MLRPQHVWIWSLTSAGIALLLAGLVVLFSVATDLDPRLETILLAGLSPIVAGCSALTSVAWHAYRTRKTLANFANLLTNARNHPTRATFGGAELSEAESAALGPAHSAAEQLCLSYRQALTDRVKQRDALEKLQKRAGRSENGHTRPANRRVPGASRNMVARLTPNLHWMNLTPALQKLLGYTSRELNGRAFLDQVKASHVANLRRAFEACSTSGEGHHLDFCMVVRRPGNGKNGHNGHGTEHRYVSMDVLTRYSDDGQPLNFRCYFDDITDRVRAERKLRKRTAELQQTNERLVRINEDLQRLKESYRDLYHNAPIMFFSLDSRGHFVACNDTMVRALGYRREQLHEQSYAVLLAGERSREWLASLNQDGVDGRPHPLMTSAEVETKWVKSDGSVIDVWIRTIPLTDGSGQFVRSRSAAQDVTQRNRLANELRRHSEELQQANGELRAINSELNQFTSGVSHDLKEPLRTLELYSNLLAEEYSTQLGADGFGYVNLMLTASRRLAKRIDELLTLSRAGRIATTPRVFHLNEAIALVRRDLGDMMQRKNATLTVEGSLPTLVGDLERVVQLLTNLVANGLKYNKSPEPRVLIAEAPRQDRAGFATLLVRDNGIGIDPQFHQEIFSLFRRLHTQGEYEGSGAGLAICKKIVQAHGGQIWVESTPGQGSTFYFTLPRSPNAAAARIAVPAGPGEVETPAPPVAAFLLLVEDMPEIGLIVQRLARKAGHDIDWVQTGEAAWEHLQKIQPDLVLLDIHLPGIDGIELCRQLRKSPAHAKLPIALFSQGVHSEEIAAGLAAGANYVLSKELLCEPESWRQQLAKILHNSKQGSATHRALQVESASGHANEGQA